MEWSTPVWQEGVLSGHVHMCTAAYHWCWWQAVSRGPLVLTAFQHMSNITSTAAAVSTLLQWQMLAPADSSCMADMDSAVALRHVLKCPRSHGGMVSLQALELAPVNPDPQPSEAVCNGIRLPSTTVRRGSTAAAGPAAAGRTGGSRAASRSEAPGDNEAESPPEVWCGKKHVYGCQHQSGIMFMNKNQVICTVDNRLTAC